MAEVATESSKMAKIQKSLMVNEDLIRLIEAHQRRTGASFTRVMTAAVMQYLFTQPEGPDALWMEHAVELELDEITVGDMPEQRINDLTANSYGEVGSSEIIPGSEPKEIPPEFGKMYRRWKKLVRRSSDDPVQKIIDHWGDKGRSK